jgi:Predicted membrane protein
VWTSAGSVVMLVIMLLFLVMLVAAAVLAVQASRRRSETLNADRAEQLLAERFAGGEIDADEYQRRSELLRAGRR